MTPNYGLNPSMHIPYKIPPLVSRQILREVMGLHGCCGDVQLLDVPSAKMNYLVDVWRLITQMRQ